MKDLKKADFAETAIEFGKYVQQQWVVVRTMIVQCNKCKEDLTSQALLLLKDKIKRIVCKCKKHKTNTNKVG